MKFILSNSQQVILCKAESYSKCKMNEKSAQIFSENIRDWLISEYNWLINWLWCHSPNPVAFVIGQLIYIP